MSDVFTIQGSYDLVDNVTAKLEKVQKNVDKATKELDTQEKAWGKIKTASGNAMTKIDSFVKKSVTLVSGLTVGMVALGIKSNASLEGSRASWETLLGSQEKAVEMLEDIEKYSATTPFSKMGVDEMAKQLNNAGYSGEGLFTQLTKFGDMGGAFGVQEDSLKEMVRQYSQVQMATVAYTEDLNILQDRGIPIYKALSEVTGVAVADIKKMASEGEITADIYNKAIDSIAEKTKGSMDKQSQTFNGMWSTISDGFTNIMQQIIEPLFKKIIDNMPTIITFFDTFSAKLKDGGGFLASIKESITIVFGEDILKKIEKVVETIKGLTIAYLALKTVMFVANTITTLASAWGVLSAALGINAVAAGTATVATTGLNVALLANPITWVVLAIAALVAGLIDLWVNMDKHKARWTNTWNIIKAITEVSIRFLIEKFFEMKAKAEEVGNKIEYIFKHPIQAAANFFGTQIQKMKDYLNFTWKFPNLKMPHFSFSGSINPLDWGKVGVPKVGVQWYSSGAIFTQPTVIGNRGVGDAQNGVGSKAEAVLPIDDLRGMIKDLLQVQIAMVVDGREFVRQVVAPHNEEITEYNKQFSYR